MITKIQKPGARDVAQWQSALKKKNPKLEKAAV
jgi:hypothetical protein